MKSRPLKVARIGNSRGVRLPAEVLARYDIGDTVIMEERDDGILLRSHGSRVAKLTWAHTADQMAREREHWEEWDTAIADGLDTIPWDESKSRHVAEPKKKYPRKRG
jgi:antitoxin component of MazEF toxin-antitoxin module